jgi:hypothetical protein
MCRVEARWSRKRRVPILPDRDGVFLQLKKDPPHIPLFIKAQRINPFSVAVV